MGGWGRGQSGAKESCEGSTLGLECQLGIGLWNSGENQVLSQSLTKRGHCPRSWSHMYACVHAKWLQSCLTLCNPRGCSPPGSSRQEYRSWLSFLSSRGLPHPGLPRLSRLLHWQQGSLPPVPPRKPSRMDVPCYASPLSRVRLFATPRTVAHQAPLFTGTLQARILEWVAMPSSRGFPNPGIKPRSPALQADSLQSEPPGKPENTGVGSQSLLRGDLPNPGIKPVSPAL